MYLRSPILFTGLTSRKTQISLYVRFNIIMKQHVGKHLFTISSQLKSYELYPKVSLILN
jgi:hypothetical protein